MVPKAYTRPLPKIIDTPEWRELLAEHEQRMDEGFAELDKQRDALMAEAARRKK